MCCKSAFGMCDDPFQAQGRFTGWLGAGLHESLGANGTRNGLLSEGLDLKSLKTIEIQGFFSFPFVFFVCIFSLFRG